MCIRDRDNGTLIANPGGATQMAAGQLLIVLGSKTQLSTFQRLLGEAVDTIESMPG